MGLGQSCHPSDAEKSTKSGNYVEELLEIKRANFMSSHSMEPTEVLQQRKERILKVLKERKPAKPYAIQLMEARAAAQSELSIPEKLEEPKVTTNAQSNHIPGEKRNRGPDHKSRILQRIAARRKSKQPTETVSPDISTTLPNEVINSPTPAFNTLRSPDVSSTPSSNASTMTSPVANDCSSSEVSQSPSSSIHTLPPPASNKATQSDPPIQIAVQSTASQSSSFGRPVDSAIQVTPALHSSPQQTIRLSEPKMYIQPPMPPQTKIFIPSPHRLMYKPPLSARQTVSAAFSTSSSPLPEDSCVTPSPSNINGLLESVCMDKLSKMSIPIEEKRRYNMDPLSMITNSIYSIPSKQSLTNDEEKPLEFESEDNCGKRYTAAVDRLTDSLMANWSKRQTSAELLGASEDELSLLTYGESKRRAVPHYPIWKDKDRISRGPSICGNDLVINDILPPVRFDNTCISLAYCDLGREKRCFRHRPNKI